MLTFGNKPEMLFNLDNHTIKSEDKVRQMLDSIQVGGEKFCSHNYKLCTLTILSGFSFFLLRPAQNPRCNTKSKVYSAGTLVLARLIYPL